MKHTTGYIYLAHNKNGELYKVGRSQNPKMRMHTLNADWGSGVWELIHSFYVQDLRLWENYFISLYRPFSCQVTDMSREYFELPSCAVDHFKRFEGRVLNRPSSNKIAKMAIGQDATVVAVREANLNKIQW